MVEFKLQFDRLPTDIKIHSAHGAGSRLALKPIGGSRSNVAIESAEAQQQAKQLAEKAQQHAAEQAELEQQRRLVQQATDSMQNIVNGISSLNRQLEAQQQQLTVIALEFAGAIASSLFENDADLITQRLKTQIQLSVDQLDTEADISIVVHPDCFAVIQEHFENQTLPNRVSWSAADHLRPGDCIVESNSLGLLARLDIQLERIREQFVASIVQGGGE